MLNDFFDDQYPVSLSRFLQAAILASLPFLPEGLCRLASGVLPLRWTLVMIVAVLEAFPLARLIARALRDRTEERRICRYLEARECLRAE